MVFYKINILCIKNLEWYGKMWWLFIWRPPLVPAGASWLPPAPAAESSLIGFRSGMKTTAVSLSPTAATIMTVAVTVSRTAGWSCCFLSSNHSRRCCRCPCRMVSRRSCPSFSSSRFLRSRVFVCKQLLEINRYTSTQTLLLHGHTYSVLHNLAFYPLTMYLCPV